MQKNKYISNIILTSAIILSVLIAFNYSFSKLALTWQHSNTYGHGFLILPVVLLLINNERLKLSTIEAKPSFFALFLIAVTSIVWFISTLTYINVVEQFVLFTLIIVIVWAFYGWNIVKFLKFPLAFLYFSIPVGDFLIPYLQFITADISVFLIQVLGIPVFRDGMYIQIPNGNFLVAEACSGIRFLISTTTMGVLFAYLNFTKLYKQITFVTICIMVAIVGNGLRAFLMILIGHLSNMKAAVGFDHLVYGWVFFSIITVILFFVGNYMADKDEEKPDGKLISHLPEKNQTYPTIVFMAIAFIFLLTGPLLKYKYDNYVTGIINNTELKSVESKSKHVNALSKKAEWLPTYPEADIVKALSVQVHHNTIDIYTAEYVFEADDKEIISYKNRLFDPNKWSLKSISTNELIDDDKNAIPYTTHVIVNLRGIEREVRVVYKAGNTLVANKIHLKFLQLVNKVLLNDFGGKIIVISSNNKENASQILDQFMSQHLLTTNLFE